MRSLCLTSICLAALAVETAIAQDLRPIPAAPPAVVQRIRESASGNLRRADETLIPTNEPAVTGDGTEGNSTELRETGDRRSRDMLLRQKEAELECLLNEVDRLRATIGQTSTVFVRATVVEVNRKKLGLKAEEFDKMTGLLPNAPRPSPPSTSAFRANETSGKNGVLEANPARLPLFRELVEKGAIRILAEPNLTTTSGRHAMYYDGGLIPQEVIEPGGRATLTNAGSGTKFEILPVVLTGHRIRLRTALELGRQIGVDRSDSKTTPQSKIGTRGWSTQVELQLGQTFAIGGLRTPRVGTSDAIGESGERKDADRAPATLNDPADLIEIIVFITPELVGAPNTPALLPAAGEADADAKESIAPAFLEPIDLDEFGPPMPVKKRRAIRN